MSHREKMHEGIRLFLDGLLDGVDVAKHPGLAEMIARTPERVAEAYLADLAAGYGEDPLAHLEPVPCPGAVGPVVLENVDFTSLCGHHLLPYTGTVRVGYEPAQHHVGIGGIARAIDVLARRLTLQEQLTSAIADALASALAPRAVVVRVEAEHQCLAARGARRPGHRLVTCEHRGHPDPTLLRLVLER